MKKVIIAGSRFFSNYKKLEEVCDDILDGEIVEIVSGGAQGTDKLAEEYAQLHDLPLKVFPADWDTYGKSAGFRRNLQMARYADIAILFWDGQSKGTQHMINLVKKYKLKWYIAFYTKNTLATSKQQMEFEF